MRMANKYLLSIFLTLNIFFTGVITHAHADGVAYMYDKYMQYPLRIVRENTQIGYINYENGKEHLILNVVLQSEKKEGETPGGMVWIFPVPSKPEDIEIDVMQDFFFPKKGKTVEELLRERLFTLNLITLMSQVYPSFLLLFPIHDLFRTREINYEEYSDKGFMEQMLGEGSVEVHKHVEKLGLTTELITASDGNALETYLKSKGLNFPDYVKNIIQSYIGQKFSFVISWASDLERFYFEQTGSTNQNNIYIGREFLQIEHPLQVFIKFKTDRIYFPLKLTRVYKDLNIPIYIFIKGFVTCDMGKMKIKPQVNYFVNQGKYEVPSEYASFYGPKTIRNMPVTRIHISDKPSSFIEDLYFNKGAPPEVMLIHRFTFWVFPIYVIVFIAVSCLCSLFAGIIAIPKRVRPECIELLKLGLFNCFTLVGFVLKGNSLLEKKINELYEKDEEGNNEPYKYLTSEYTIKKRFYIAFSILFLIFMFIIPYNVYIIYIHPLLEKQVPKLF
ncbi:MAG: hypothetical protein LDL53_08290 [Candidatus Hydrogenedens sp.]|nr:hypothetical protein [Candidatus Hydrogenedens sp.]